MSHLALFNQPVEGVHGFFQRRGGVIGVGIIQINVICPQLSQALVDPVFDLLFLQSLALSVAVETNLCGQNNLVPAFSVGEVFAQKGFAFVAGALPVGVIIGGIHKIPAHIQIGIQHGKSSLPGSCCSKIHSAQSDGCHFQSVGENGLIHRVLSFR